MNYIFSEIIDDLTLPMETLLTLQTHCTRDLDDAARAEIIRVCSDAFQDDASILFKLLPQDGLHILGFLGDELVAHAVRTTRWVELADLPILKTAYIDAVATVGRYQGCGFGSVVMRSIAEEIFQEDYQLCALETDRPGFYTRLGWELWLGPLYGRKEGEVVPNPEALGHVLVLRTPGTPEIDPCSEMIIQFDGRFW